MRCRYCNTKIEEKGLNFCNDKCESQYLEVSKQMLGRLTGIYPKFAIEKTLIEQIKREVKENERR